MAWNIWLVFCCLSLVSSAPTFSQMRLAGSLKSGDVKDASGLAASRVHSGVFYTHNDNGERNRIFAVDPTSGNLLATYIISGASNTDWEDIAVGPCPSSGSCIYIADTGSSAGAPRNVIYRVKEPVSLRDETLPLLDQFRFSWNEPESQCLMVDPKGDAYVISRKVGGGAIGKLDHSDWGKYDVHINNTQHASFHTTHHDPLACDISPDGTEILIKTKHDVFYYSVPNGDYIAAMQAHPVRLPYHYHTLEESIAWTASADGYYIVSQHAFSEFYFYRRLSGPHGSTSHPGVTVTSGPQLFAQGKAVSVVMSPEIDGASGLAASRVHSGVYYTHNDAGDSNRIFAVDPSSGNLQATLTITGATNADWEDIAVGPCPHGGSCIYIADTGNSAGAARNIIYRVKEPTTVTDQALPLVDQLHFTWSEQDAECLMVDPSGVAYIISKKVGGGSLAQIPVSAWGGSTLHLTNLQKVAYPTAQKDPVGCDISANGKDILVKAREHVYYYTAANRTVSAALRNPPTEVTYVRETLGEAIAWTPSGDGFYTVGEGHFLPFYYYKKL